MTSPISTPPISLSNMPQLSNNQHLQQFSLSQMSYPTSLPPATSILPIEGNIKGPTIGEDIRGPMQQYITKCHQIMNIQNGCIQFYKYTLEEKALELKEAQENIKELLKSDISRLRKIATPLRKQLESISPKTYTLPKHTDNLTINQLRELKIDLQDLIQRMQNRVYQYKQHPHQKQPHPPIDPNTNALQ